MATSPQTLFALTICAYRKPGMEEEAYHEYTSKKHAPLLKDLMAQNKIVEYTMVRILNIQYSENV